MTSIIMPVALFALSMSITPGPNNVMLTSSGANFGFIRTLPHILGIIFGLALMNILSAFGLQGLFELVPLLKKILKVVGIIYMFFLAYKIAFSMGLKKGEDKGKPLTFLQGTIFQVVNPKAVVMCLTAMSVYPLAGNYFVKSVFVIVFIFMFVGVLSISVWAAFGTVLSKFLKRDSVLRIFNYSLGLVTALSAVILIFE